MAGFSDGVNKTFVMRHSGGMEVMGYKDDLEAARAMLYRHLAMKPLAEKEAVLEQFVAILRSWLEEFEREELQGNCQHDWIYPLQPFCSDASEGKTCSKCELIAPVYDGEEG